MISRPQMARIGNGLGEGDHPGHQALLERAQVARCPPRAGRPGAEPPPPSGSPPQRSPRGWWVAWLDEAAFWGGEGGESARWARRRGWFLVELSARIWFCGAGSFGRSSGGGGAPPMVCQNTGARRSRAAPSGAEALGDPGPVHQHGGDVPGDEDRRDDGEDRAGYAAAPRALPPGARASGARRGDRRVAESSGGLPPDDSRRNVPTSSPQVLSVSRKSDVSDRSCKAAAVSPPPWRGGVGWWRGRAGFSRRSCRAAARASQCLGRAPALPPDPHPSASPTPSPQGGRKGFVDATSIVGARDIPERHTGAAFARMPSIIVRMPRTKPLAHAVGDLQEFRRLADVEGAVRAEVAIDHVDDPAGAGGHDHDLRRQEHRLGNRVGDEDHRLLSSWPRAGAAARSSGRARSRPARRRARPSGAAWGRRRGRGRSRRAAACRPRAARETSSRTRRD